MKVFTVSLPNGLLLRIDKATTGKKAICPSRSELVRSAVFMFIRDFLIKQDETIVEERDEDKDKIFVTEKNGEVTMYKIVRGLKPA